MDFTSSPLEDDIRSAIRSLCGKFSDEYWREHDASHEFPWEFYNAIAKSGWLGLTVPTEYGGGGLGVTEAAVLEMEIAASGAGMNGCSAVHVGIFGFDPIIKHGSEAMKQRYLPRLVAGDIHVSFAVTEPEAGTDTSRITTSAERVDGGYRVNGKKVWITKALEAERMILLVRTAPRDQVERRTDGMTLLFAPMDRSSIDIRPIPKMGRNAIDTNELFIDDLFVPDEDVVGEVGKGFRALLTGLNAERIISASAALGIGRVALRRATKYANDRVVFDRPIGMNQGVQFPLAEAMVRLDAAELMIRKAAWLHDNGMSCGREANEAKYLAAEAGFNAADVAVTVYGGYGYGKEFDVERYFREARLMRIAPIAQELVLSYLAEHVMGLPRSY